tara:strand:- start:3154 stop:4074 length:921 start_codon:yes stop_codon:yes gene_type:complete
MSTNKQLSSFQIIKRRLNIDSPPTVHSVATILDAIVDASGSMSSMGNAPPEQILQLMNDQRKLALESGIKIYFSLTVFSDIPTLMIDKANLSDPDYEIPTFSDLRDMLEPCGLTRFYDTVIERVAAQKADSNSILKALPYSLRSLNPTINRVVYVLTDGDDNRSTMGISDLRNCLNTNKTQNGFTAVFLAANIGNAEVVGANMGFDADTSLTIGNDAHYASVGMNHATSLLRACSGGSAPPQFTQCMRTSSQAPSSYSSAAHLAAGISDSDSDGDDSDPYITPPPQPISRRPPQLRRSNRAFGLRC